MGFNFSPQGLEKTSWTTKAHMDPNRGGAPSLTEAGATRSLETSQRHGRLAKIHLAKI